MKTTCPIKIDAITFHPLPISPKGMFGFSGFTLNNAFSVQGIAVYTRPDGSGIRCVYPTKILPHGIEIALFRPITQDATAVVTEAIEQKIRVIMGKINF